MPQDLAEDADAAVLVTGEGDHARDRAPDRAGVPRHVWLPPHQRDGTQLHHVVVEGLAEWIAWWDGHEASA